MPSDHKDKIEADIQRVTKLMRGLAERCYKQAEEDEQVNFRFDSLGIVAVVSWNDDEDEGYEDTAAAFESKRHHVQTGILVDLINGRSKSYREETH